MSIKVNFYSKLTFTFIVLIYFGRSLAWDGYHVFVGGQNGILYLWDLETFELINEIKAHSGKMCVITVIIIPN